MARWHCSRSAPTISSRSSWETIWTPSWDVTMLLKPLSSQLVSLVNRSTTWSCWEASCPSSFKLKSDRSASSSFCPHSTQSYHLTYTWMSLRIQPWSRCSTTSRRTIVSRTTSSRTGLQDRTILTGEANSTWASSSSKYSSYLRRRHHYRLRKSLESSLNLVIRHLSSNNHNSSSGRHSLRPSHKLQLAGVHSMSVTHLMTSHNPVYTMGTAGRCRRMGRLAQSTLLKKWWSLQMTRQTLMVRWILRGSRAYTMLSLWSCPSLMRRSRKRHWLRNKKPPSLKS